MLTAGGSVKTFCTTLHAAQCKMLTAGGSVKTFCTTLHIAQCVCTQHNYIEELYWTQLFGYDRRKLDYIHCMFLTETTHCENVGEEELCGGRDVGAWKGSARGPKTPEGWPFLRHSMILGKWKWFVFCLFIYKLRFVIIDQLIGVCDQGDKPKHVICQIEIN